MICLKGWIRVFVGLMHISRASNKSLYDNSKQVYATTTKYEDLKVKRVSTNLRENSASL